jgi:hypothetical protein
MDMLFGLETTDNFSRRLFVEEVAFPIPCVFCLSPLLSNEIILQGDHRYLDTGTK